MVERKKQMSRDRVSRLINWGHWFAFFNGLLAMIVGSRYLGSVGYPETWYGWVYLSVSTIGQFSFLAFIAYLICLFPLTLILPYSKILRGVAAVIATLSLCILLYDTIVYADYGMHLSPFAFDLAWADLNALLHGTSYIVTPLAIIAIELTAANFLWKRIEKIQKLNLGNKVITLVGICFVSSHLIHIWADAADITEITRFDDTYPLSYPATARSFMESHGIDGSSQGDDVNHNTSVLNYPEQPLTCQADTKINVLMITIDSLRADMVDGKSMPFLQQYTESNQSFTQHFSGGNQFRTGMFSLLYGLQGSYGDARIFNSTSPLMTRSFQQAGYELGLFLPETNLNLRSSQAMFNDFNPVIAKETNGSADADLHTVASFNEWHSIQNKPWFALVNLKAPENFDTPVGFLGIETVKADPALMPAQKVLFNQYRQSLYFVDQQLKAMLANVPKDTLVIITGVNGKMFTSNSDEANRNLSPQSVKVPLVIHWPNTGSSKVKYRTSHYGIAPTLMTHVLGCTNNTTEYSAGRSLLQPSKETWIYIGDSRIFAIYQEAEVTVIDRHGKYRIYDENYEHRLNKKMSAPELIEV
ncbi:MAG TPA: sulfatase, partial [Shewanella baltica]|nr:sulfatase [Shewanella baltica]